MLSSVIICQASFVVLLMSTFTTTSNIPVHPTSVVDEISQLYHDERNPSAHHFSPSLKQQLLLTDDDSLSDEVYSNEQDIIIGKRYVNKILGGDSRIWPIPYRFGKRSAMPYRFGKRAGMHYRLGKRSLST